jgi:hypothetical protein
MLAKLKIFFLGSTHSICTRRAFSEKNINKNKNKIKYLYYLNCLKISNHCLKCPEQDSGDSSSEHLLELWGFASPQMQLQGQDVPGSSRPPTRPPSTSQWTITEDNLASEQTAERVNRSKPSKMPTEGGRVTKPKARQSQTSRRVKKPPTKSK